MATSAGFLDFVRNVMGIPSGELPDNSPTLVTAYGVAVETTNCFFATLASPIYDLAVYNLGGDYVINWAPNISPSTYFTDLRKTYKIGAFVAGVIASTADESTSESMTVPDFFQALTLSDLQLLKTPYGRYYLSIAQKFGTLWGLS